MKDAETLYDEWTSGETSGLRPQRVQELRMDIQEATGMPVPHRVHELEGWTERMKGQVTRKLKEATENDSEASDGGSDDAEDS